ncbi:MAG: hypothetical protein ACTS22_06205 [Phycisphaerales bacterium]
MATIDRPERTAWLDRFSKPTAEALLRGYPQESADLLADLVSELTSRTGRAPTVQWMGIPWRWSIAFRRSSDAEPWAFLVPMDEAPVLAMPLAADVLDGPAGRALPKSLRDPIARAPMVGQVRWAEWPLLSHHAATELLSFIDLVCEPHAN